MVKKRNLPFLFLFLWTCVFSFTGISCAGEESARHPFVSGTFYPADKAKLSGMIDDFLARVPSEKKIEGEIVALILPHAGYVYSGQVAAYGYKLIEGRDFDTVVLIGLYHKAPLLGASVWRSGDWKTPLGTVKVDSELAEAIARENEAFQFTQDAHLAEHSLEVHIPFLQKVLKDFKIVPILTSTPSLEISRALAKAIVENTRGRKALIIVSTDMSHYHSDDVAREMDRRALELLEKKDSEGFLGDLQAGKIELCGSAATLTALEIAERVGDTKVEVLKYANSGDVTGERESVVGYGSLVIYKGKGNPGTAAPANTLGADTTEAETLAAQQQKELSKISRKTLEGYVQTGKTPEFQVTDPELKKERAVFVTLRKFGQLRGCIGRLVPEEPLYLAVRNMTVESAAKDPRFKPVRPGELKDLDIEISVLSLPKRIQSVDEIELGKHGVIVKQGDQSGVFLPKVATETLWSKEEFLSELCAEKAGLPSDCWQDPATEIYTFTSFDFEE